MCDIKKYFIDIWCDLRTDDEGRDYGDSRPYKRTLDDRDGLGEVSQIPSNNSSHTTKKKGRKNTKFNTHENTFSPVSGLDTIPRAIPQLMSSNTIHLASCNNHISRSSIILHWRHLVPQDGGAAEDGAGPGAGDREALGPERGSGPGQGARAEIRIQEEIPRRLPPGCSL